MRSFDTKSLTGQEKRPGFIGRFIHSDHMSVAHWEIKKGSLLERHSHPHEQVTFILSGKILFKTAAGDVTLETGQGAVFAPEEPHEGIILEDSIVVDLFTPVREDFKD